MKTRVMEVVASLSRGGAERIATTLARKLDPQHFETAAVALYDAGPGSLKPELDEAQVPVWTLGKRRGLDPRMWTRLARVLRSYGPHVVHTHSYVLRYVWPAAQTAGNAVIVHTIHNVADKEVEWLGRWFNRMAFRSGAVAVAISREVARSFRRVYGHEPDAVIPNGIHLEAYQDCGKRAEWRQAHGFQANDLLIASVARLDPQKDPLSLIRAFEKGLKEDGNCHLLLAGRGSLETEARLLAEAVGLRRRIHFLGTVTDVAAMLAACDIFALSSKWEGSPLAVMEAMAAGLPVVATAVGGVPELVEHEVTGLLVSPGDTARAAEALQSLARNPEKRRRLGTAARQKAVQFSDEKMTSAYGELFERLRETRR